MGEYGRALETLTEVRDRATAAGDELIAALPVMYLSLVRWITEPGFGSHEMLAELERAAPVVEAAGHEFGIAKIHDGRAFAYSHLGQSDRSEREALLAIEHARRGRRRSDRGRAVLVPRLGARARADARRGRDCPLPRAPPRAQRRRRRRGPPPLRARRARGPPASLRGGTRADPARRCDLRGDRESREREEGQRGPGEGDDDQQADGERRRRSHAGQGLEDEMGQPERTLVEVLKVAGRNPCRRRRVPS